MPLLEVHVLVLREMYCKAYDCVTSVVKFVLHDSEHCLVWSNISCVEIL